MPAACGGQQQQRQRRLDTAWVSRRRPASKSASRAVLARSIRFRHPRTSEKPPTTDPRHSAAGEGDVVLLGRLRTSTPSPCATSAGNLTRVVLSLARKSHAAPVLSFAPRQRPALGWLGRSGRSSVLLEDRPGGPRRCWLRLRGAASRGSARLTGSGRERRQLHGGMASGAARSLCCPRPASPRGVVRAQGRGFVPQSGRASSGGVEECCHPAVCCPLSRSAV
eukprot:COSAG06_NODE_2862_length_6156_cov_37.661165_2_plen_223_part_00